MESIFRYIPTYYTSHKENTQHQTAVTVAMRRLYIYSRRRRVQEHTRHLVKRELRYKLYEILELYSSLLQLKQRKYFMLLSNMILYFRNQFFAE